VLGPRTRHILALEFGSQAQFHDPSREWRRLFAELFGSFLLVLAAAGGAILHGKGQISLAAAVVAPGLTVMGIILFMGAVSRAHLNPGALVSGPPWSAATSRATGYTCSGRSPAR
jgi:aquaporin Z